MKFAIGIKDKTTKELNEMFARSSLFLILEIENGKIINESFTENILSNQTSGAGTAVIERLAKLDIDGIICLNLGPKALDLCRQLQLKTFKTEVADFRKTMDLFLSNNLKEIE
jgi:predicted Fe-Mo cluster-binding NifX family protein